jgi:16S rRNA (adenine1518-N6/adenine1519-N6)-dimethyltransferase
LKQRKRVLRELFKARGIFAERKLGQCFLVDGNLQVLIADAAELGPGDLVLEVGTGTGQLTGVMIGRAGGIVSVEISRDLHALATEQLGEHPHLTLVRADILAGKHHLNPDVVAMLREKLVGLSNLKVVANLPYYIALPLIQNLLESGLPWERMVVTVQREFAEKMTARPGVKQYGAFSILFQCWAGAKVLRLLPPSVFWPAPRVDSAIVRIFPQMRLLEGVDYDLLREVVRTSFSARRKKIRNALGRLALKAETDPIDLLSAAEIDPSKRPEELHPEDFMKIALSLKP